MSGWALQHGVQTAFSSIFSRIDVQDTLRNASRAYLPRKLDLE